MGMTVEVPELPELTFDEASHIYRLNGEIIPSVSELMEPLKDQCYGGISKRTLENAAIKGSAVHNSIENWIKFGIDDIPSEHRGYFNGFVEWWKQYKPRVFGSEVRIYHKLMRYKKGQRLRDEDKKAHEMHMGFSFEEKQRCKDSPNPMFVNRFPLVDMELTRADNYAYILDVWGLDTKASACCFCPFHRNYFFENLKEHQPQTYAKLLEVDELLRDKNPKPPMDSDLFISRSRKRLADLTPEDCCDAECFEYHGKKIWNGF